jgi:hypothetical protein
MNDQAITSDGRFERYVALILFRFYYLEKPFEALAEHRDEIDLGQFPRTEEHFRILERALDAQESDIAAQVEKEIDELGQELRAEMPDFDQKIDLIYAILH